MKPQTQPTPTTIHCNESEEGETIEMKVRRIMEQNEPITDGAPMIYTDRSHGVSPETDIRTDRFDLALEATDKIAAQKLAKRKEILDAKEPKKEPKKEPTPGNPEL